MLSERDRAILDFAGRTYRYLGAKEQAIRDEFGMSSTRYHQALNQLIDNPEAWAYAPGTVQRMRRLRGKGMRVRRDVGRGLRSA